VIFLCFSSMIKQRRAKFQAQDLGDYYLSEVCASDVFFLVPFALLSDIRKLWCV